jgi:serine/threonine protein phosphatase 1
MRVLAIGDIHGCTTALDVLLAEVQPTPDDLIITLGDYVDRGPDSSGAIERLLRLRKTLRLVSLRGNHEVMMQGARRDWEHYRTWFACGGEEALESYAQPGKNGCLADVPATHWEFLDRDCRDWYETDSHFFVHANAHPDIPLAEQPDYMLHWESLEATISMPHESGKVMVCGHTSQKSGLPLNLDHLICIDTWVYGNGWLTCLDVASGKVWQANQRGEHREAWLDEIAREV